MEIDRNIIYLGISLFSFWCTFSERYIIPCSNMVGLMCMVDLYFVNKKDMMLHHILVLCMIHYMNTHDSFENRTEITSVILKTEISTIFLTTNHLLKNTNVSIIKHVNKLCFVSSFLYYRIYQYSYVMFDKNTKYLFFINSKNNFELYEIYIGVYGMLMLNVYWKVMICKHLYQHWRKGI